MTKIIGMPSKYVQGYNEILNIEKYITIYGDSFLFIIDDHLYDDLSLKLKKILANYKTIFAKFAGEVTKNEINRLRAKVKDDKLKVVIGVGSGKTIDTAKAVSFYEQCPIVICPTAASCDAPCSALSVIYKENGEFEEYLFFTKNCDIVLVDSNICSKAPLRLLVAGMGDALATYFEARAVAKSGKKNFFHASPTITGLKLARICYETLLADGYKAKIAVEAKACTIAVENIIENNILLSGLGFESGGLAAAHAFYNAFTTVVKDQNYYLHGEKVAFGTLVHLFLENADSEEIQEVLEFCYSVNLPICLADIGIKTIDEKQIMQIATKACDKNETMHNMPFAVSIEDVYHAILAANNYGTKFKNYKKYKQNLQP